MSVSISVVARSKANLWTLTVQWGQYCCVTLYISSANIDKLAPWILYTASQFHSLWSASMKKKIYISWSQFLNAYSIHLTFVRACSCRTSNPLKSQWLLQAARKAPVNLSKNAAALCWKWGTLIYKTLQVACVTRHMSVGVTSNTYCNRNKCTFTVTSTTTYILLPPGTQEIFAHPV